MIASAKEPKMPNRHVDTPRDKPFAERTEHGNHDRPGAQAHPHAARGWSFYAGPATWRLQ